MSYDSTTMRLLGGVPGQQMFMYRTADNITDIEVSGYFDPAVEHYNLSTGDIILAVTSFDSANALAGLVTTVTGTTATVSKLA